MGLAFLPVLYLQASLPAQVAVAAAEGLMVRASFPPILSWTDDRGSKDWALVSAADVLLCSGLELTAVVRPQVPRARERAALLHPIHWR